MKPLLFCKIKNHYTMIEECHGEKALSREPPKYSPEDKYAKYRREAKNEEYEKKGYT